MPEHPERAHFVRGGKRRTSQERFDKIVNKIESVYDVKRSEQGRMLLLELAKEYSVQELDIASTIAVEYYEDVVEAFIKLKGILYNRRRTYNRYIESEGSGNGRAQDVCKDDN